MKLALSWPAPTSRCLQHLSDIRRRHLDAVAAAFLELQVGGRPASRFSTATWSCCVSASGREVREARRESFLAGLASCSVGRAWDQWMLSLLKHSVAFANWKNFVTTTQGWDSYIITKNTYILCKKIGFVTNLSRLRKYVRHHRSSREVLPANTTEKI